MSDKEELKPEVRAQISSVMRSTDLAPKEKQRRVQLLMSSGDVIDFEKLAAEEEEQKKAQHQSGEEHADAKDDGDEKNKTQEKEEEKEKEEEEEAMPQSEIDAAIGEGVWRDKEHTVRGCAHYMRGCYIRAACCGHVYPCRLCHDAAEDHEIDRFATHEIVCATCHRLQPLSNHCTNPACRDAPAFGTVHYCEPCRIWSSDPAKPMFHCDKCRLCRVGTRDTVTHCDACGCCYNNAAFADHQCRANRLDGLCPVCMGRLFDSTDPATFLECGHTIHAKCFRALLRSGDPRCPLCKKCVVDMKLAHLETALERRSPSPTRPGSPSSTATSAAPSPSSPSTSSAIAAPRATRSTPPSSPSGPAPRTTPPPPPSTSRTSHARSQSSSPSSAKNATRNRSSPRNILLTRTAAAAAVMTRASWAWRSLTRAAMENLSA